MGDCPGLLDGCVLARRPGIGLTSSPYGAHARRGFERIRKEDDAGVGLHSGILGSRTTIERGAAMKFGIHLPQSRLPGDFSCDTRRRGLDELGQGDGDTGIAVVDLEPPSPL